MKKDTDIEGLIVRFQEKARLMDMGDITSRPRTSWIELKKDDIIDLMIDAYFMGTRDTLERMEEELGKEAGS